MTIWYHTSKGRIVPASTKLGKDEYPKWQAKEGDKEWKRVRRKKSEDSSSKQLTPDSRLLI